MIETYEQLQDTAASEPLPGLPQKRRIWRGAKVLQAYIEVYGPGFESEDIDTIISDLIADLGHLADEAEVDYEHAVEWGMNHLDSEREENE